MVCALGCGGSAEVSGGDPGSSYERLTLEITGGYGPAPCSIGKDSYEVTRAPDHFTWAVCDYGKNPAEPVMGDRSLSGAEVASVTQALGNVRVSSAKNCGADAAVLTLDESTQLGVKRYANDFYSGCPWEAQAGRTFVTGLEQLHGALSQLSKQ